MEIKMKRLKNIDKEDFCLVFFDGTRMPNNPEYIEITMFNDVFYIDNGKEEKEYKNDIYWIMMVKKLVQDSIENIERMLVSKAEYVRKSSYNHKIDIKINNKIYNINRNECNEEGQKIFDDFKLKLYEILKIEKN